MFVLGLQGSPRKKGNTEYLLSIFLREAEQLGATTQVIEVDKKNIVPCRQFGRSDKSKIARIKAQHDPLAFVVREHDIFKSTVHKRTGLEVRSRFTYLSDHLSFLLYPLNLFC